MRRMLETHTAENLVHVHMWIVLVEYFPSTIDTRSRINESAIHVEEADDEGFYSNHGRTSRAGSLT